MLSPQVHIFILHLVFLSGSPVPHPLSCLKNKNPETQRFRVQSTNNFIFQVKVYKTSLAGGTDVLIKLNLMRLSFQTEEIILFNLLIDQ
jgi:hypothetical protein